AEYADKKLHYITVKHQLKSRLLSLKNWTDISEQIYLNGAYSTMGIDRRALCLSYKDGVFISAGSAITVDVVENGNYKGGFLLLGIRAYLNAYASISPALKSELNIDIKLSTLPQTTKDGISYGIIASIKSVIKNMLIEQHQSDKKIYISGGDGEFLSSFFENAHFDETLIFRGMRNALKEQTC
ncbi:MAG TPA: type III pantothenate kinase, partial [Campylobacterales bacterium]|nr:type III pantothenate kinase [Campylobacterales bacterium]